ncbi:putative reverse transcriptase domain-containing protein [Tanacetum coccineum]
MTTASQGMSVQEIEQIVAKRVANAIEVIAIYESINQAKQRENKVAGNASNKRKLSNKEDYVGNLPWCNMCNFHHIGQCAKKYGNCKRRGHQARDCRISVLRAKQRSIVLGKKAEVICYGCGGLGHYKSNCPIVKFQNSVNMYWKGKARGDSSAATSNINI